GARRPQAPAAGDDQPAVQRRQVLPRGRRGRDQRRGFRRQRAHRGARPGARHPGSVPRPHLRPLHPGRLHRHAPEGRQRPRPRDLQAPDRADAGPHRLREPGRRRRHVLVRAAAAERRLEWGPAMPDRPLTRICYVEDDEDIQRIVRMSLERVGKMTVAVVSDPTQALQAFAEFRPDLVMLDWMMPKLDGPALFKLMQDRPETKALPVVFITAKASQRDLDQLMKLGAAATISKPFSPKDLPEQLREIWKKLP